MVVEMDTEQIKWTYRTGIRQRKDKKNNKTTLYINVPTHYHEEIKNKLKEGWAVDVTLKPCYLKEVQ